LCIHNATLGVTARNHRNDKSAALPDYSNSAAANGTLGGALGTGCAGNMYYGRQRGNETLAATFPERPSVTSARSTLGLEATGYVHKGYACCCVGCRIFGNALQNGGLRQGRHRPGKRHSASSACAQYQANQYCELFLQFAHFTEVRFRAGPCSIAHEHVMNTQIYALKA
jgi:hypothetical protein